MSWDYYETDKLYELFGVDLSQHNRYDLGAVPDRLREYKWELLAPRCSFMGFRLAWRQYIDVDLNYHVETLENEYPDMPYFLYQWFDVKRSNTNIKRQYAAMQQVVNEYGMPPMGLMFDIEDNPDGLSKQEFGDQYAKVLGWAFSDFGPENIWTYTSTYYWEQFLGRGNAAYKTDMPKKTKLLVARYHVGVPTPDYGFRLPTDWEDLRNPPYLGKNWIGWQYSADGNKLGNGKTEGVPSFGVHSYSIDLDRLFLTATQFKSLFGVYPHPITLPLMRDPAEPPPSPPPSPPPPPPPPDPDRVKIVGLLDGEQLNMRDAPWGLINAKTFNGAQFDVMSTVKDVNDRKWYQVGKNIYIASWYTQEVQS
jgi:hypothetical protein